MLLITTHAELTLELPKLTYIIDIILRVSYLAFR